MTDKLIKEVEGNDKIEIPLAPQLKDNPPVIPESAQGIIDPLDSITKDEERECAIRAIQKVNKTHNRELELEKSQIRTPNQEFLVVSFVGPQCRQKTDVCGMKVWGAFPDQASANKWAGFVSRAKENKKLYDVYVLEMYCWCAIPPTPEMCANQEYHDKRLDKLIKTHKAQEMKKHEVFDLRKNKLKQQGLSASEKKELEEVEKERIKNSEERMKNPENNEVQRQSVIETEPLPKYTVKEVPKDDPKYINHAVGGIHENVNKVFDQEDPFVTKDAVYGRSLNKSE